MDNILDSKCMAFAVRIVRFYKFLVHDKKETVISKQMLRSGTSIGANARESETHKVNLILFTNFQLPLRRLMKHNIGLNFFSIAI